jgi:hypothetical protein
MHNGLAGVHGEPAGFQGEQSPCGIIARRRPSLAGVTDAQLGQDQRGTLQVAFELWRKAWM